MEPFIAAGLWNDYLAPWVAAHLFAAMAIVVGAIVAIMVLNLVRGYRP